MAPSRAITTARQWFGTKQRPMPCRPHALRVPLGNLLVGAKTDALMLDTGPDRIEVRHLATQSREGGPGLLKKAALVVRRPVP